MQRPVLVNRTNARLTLSRSKKRPAFGISETGQKNTTSYFKLANQVSTSLRV
jgi:hypothetical protein